MNYRGRVLMRIRYIPKFFLCVSNGFQIKIDFIFFLLTPRGWGGIILMYEGNLTFLYLFPIEKSVFS